MQSTAGIAERGALQLILADTSSALNDTDTTNTRRIQAASQTGCCSETV